MNKKEKLKQKLKIMDKMLKEKNNKDEMLKIMIEEQNKNKEILDPSILNVRNGK